MPNHVINKVTLSGNKELIAKLKEMVKGDEERPFDFNKIIPMPVELEGTTSPNHDIKQASHLKLKYGYTDWYNWHCDKWGTKWNSYDHNPDTSYDFEFQTAWSCPEPVFAALAKKYPDVEITVAFADEDIGSNCGTLICQGDEMEFIEPEKGKESRKFALDLWERDLSEYDDDYNWKEH